MEKVWGEFGASLGARLKASLGSQFEMQFARQSAISQGWEELHEKVELYLMAGWIALTIYAQFDPVLDRLITFRRYWMVQ